MMLGPKGAVLMGIVGLVGVQEVEWGGGLGWVALPGQTHGKRIFATVTYRIRVGGQSQKFNPIGHGFCEFFGTAKRKWMKALCVCIHKCKARLPACATSP